MKKGIVLLIVMVAFLGRHANSHCEVPCGIYDDQLRANLIWEHFVTIEKAMKQIEALSAEENPNYNQIVRWVNTKEEHANKIQEIVSQYFLHQRVKIKEKGEEGYDKYIEQLTTCHQILVFAMKTKQSTDLASVESGRESLAKFEISYFGKKLDHHTH